MISVLLNRGSKKTSDPGEHFDHSWLPGEDWSGVHALNIEYRVSNLSTFFELRPGKQGVARKAPLIARGSVAEK